MLSSLLTDSTVVQKNELRAATNSPKNINEDDSLVELVEVLEDINENKKIAKLNKISIVDSKGGRIYF
jgi:hypothetical protein